MPLDNDRFKNLLISMPEKAIGYLFEYYHATLLRFSRRYTFDPKASEDIVQETFTALWKNHQRLAQTPDLAITPYLFAIVKNKSISFYRMNMERNEQPFDDTSNQLSHNGFSTEAEIISSEELKFVSRILTSLPLRERQCMTMKYYGNMSNEEIAAELSVTVKAVEGRITSAYKRIRQYKSSMR